MSENDSIAAAAATHETQKSICEWAARTFGTSGSDARVAARANEEMSELVRAVTADAPHAEILDEVADVLIVLARVGDRLNVALSFEPRHPMMSILDFTPTQVATLANFQLAGLLNELAWGRAHFSARGFLEQIWASLHEIARMTGSTAQAVVDAKMAKNHKRVWKRDGTGHGYHVRDKSLAP